MSFLAALCGVLNTGFFTALCRIPAACFFLRDSTSCFLIYG
jgi:hypothetical protein